jgi:hypothetical protein
VQDVVVGEVMRSHVVAWLALRPSIVGLLVMGFRRQSPHCELHVLLLRVVGDVTAILLLNSTDAMAVVVSQREAGTTVCVVWHINIAVAAAAGAVIPLRQTRICMLTCPQFGRERNPSMFSDLHYFHESAS